MKGAGTALVPAGSSLLVTSYTALSGGLLLDQRGTLEFQGDYWLTTDGTSAIANSGTITKTAGASMSIVEPTVTNSGTISVPTGWITLPAGALTNYSAATKTLTGGTYRITAPGMLRINDADITTLAANVVLDGAAAKIEDSSANNALRNLTSVAPSGYLGLDAGQALTTAPLTNRGYVVDRRGRHPDGGERRLHPGRRSDRARRPRRPPSPRAAPAPRCASQAASSTAAARSAPALTNSGGYLSPGGRDASRDAQRRRVPARRAPAGALLVDIAGPAAGGYGRSAP